MSRAVILFVLLVCAESFQAPISEPRLDRFGGLLDKPSPNGGTGFFRIEKFGNRWMFVTPEGNAFWLKAMYDVQLVPDAAVLAAKYGGDGRKYQNHRNRRLLAWGFNALGEYASTVGLPVGTWGSEPMEVKLPFILMLNPALGAMYNPAPLGLPEAVKGVIGSGDGNGVPASTYNDWRGPLVDVWDPKFTQACAAEVAYWSRAIDGGFADKPWVIGITIGDADQLFGFKSRGDAPVVPYPHPAFMVATTNFRYSGYQDGRLYTKYAWIEFLKARYGGVGELNAAWNTGAFYTSFDDDGGWGVGAGVIDEDGRHKAWMGSNPFLLKDASPRLKADLDAFLRLFAKKYAESVGQAIRQVDRNHLIFGPAAVNNYGAKARDEVLLGLAEGGIDAFQFSYDPVYGPMAGSMAENNRSYDLTGKPAYIWYSVTANADSSLYNSVPVYGAPDLPNQRLRGKHYARVDIPNFLDARGSNGDYYVLGFDWWELYDSPGEGTNWGILTRSDNAYDGKEAVVARGLDPWGYPTGGEARDYGDFLSSAVRANLDAVRRLAAER